MSLRRRFFLCLFTLMISLTAVFGLFLVNFGHKIINPTEHETILHIPKGANARQLIFSLNHPNEVLPLRVTFFWMRLMGYASEIKAGYYVVSPQETLRHFLLRVINNDVLTRSFTVIEGTTQATISDNFQHAAYLQYKPEYWNQIETDHVLKEGLLLSETYQYDAGSDALRIIIQANQRLNEVLQSAWKTKNSLVPYRTPYELLIAASIIEKEGKTTNDKLLISGVIVNRLKKHMPLQMDATVVYALGSRFNGVVAKHDLLIDSPYNSYLHYGLPPTPIAMVGKEAIDAAAHPSISNFLYYVTKGDGSHEFSASYSQQLQAIHRYHPKGTSRGTP